MKRILLASLLIPCFGFAMQDGKGENPIAAQQLKKQDAKGDAVVAGAEAKPASATSSNTSAQAKKGFLARCFVCCNGKSEAK